MVRSTIILSISLVFLHTILGQYKFKDEETWKYAYEMIYQADLGNCDLAYKMFDTLIIDSNFNHGASYIAFANCLQKNGQEAEASSFIQKAKEDGILGKTYSEDSITHPALRERFLLMYLEDQGSWSLDDNFIIDPDVRKSMSIAGIKFEKLKPKIRRLPGRELHKLHIKELDEIISEHGFPNYDMVGYFAMKGISLVILHSNLETLEKYQEEFKQYFGMKRMAYLIDKKRVANKEKQLYGTQGDFDAEGHLIFYPIEQEYEINTRRRSAGMSPIEIYARRLGVQNYTIPLPEKK